MIHAKFQDHRTSGSGEEYFKGVYHIWAWRSSWSYDLDHLYKLSFSLLKEAPHEIWHGLAKWFQRICLKIMVMYMYIAPGQGQTTPWQQIFFINSILQLIKSFAARFPPLNDFVTVFPIQTHRRPKIDLAVK